MLDNAQEADGRPHGALMRLATLLIGSVELILFILFAHVMLQSTDPLGAAIGEGMALLIGVPVAALTLPGLILAWLDRAPRTALALVLVALPIASILWLKA
jgi:hypothetical protein